MLVEKEIQMKNYELMVALKPLLPDDLRKSLHKDFTKLMSQDGGDVVDVDVWGKRYLAYKIDGHNEGYYIVYNFRNHPGNINEMKRQLQLKQEILRFMIIEVDRPQDIGKRIKKKEIEV